MSKTSFLVRFTECDPYGIASHPNYLNWLMECRVDYLKKCGLTQNEFKESDVLLVIVRVNLVCKTPCTYGDVVVVNTKLKNINHRSIAFTYVCTHKDSGKVVFEAETVNFVVNSKGKMGEFPEDMLNKIKEFDSKDTNTID